MNVKIGLRKWPKRAILAVFWTFLKGPLREFAQTALKCSFSRARFTGAIGSDVQFKRGLARNKTRSALALHQQGCGFEPRLDLHSPSGWWSDAHCNPNQDGRPSVYTRIVRQWGGAYCKYSLTAHMSPPVLARK